MIEACLDRLDIEEAATERAAEEKAAAAEQAAGLLEQHRREKGLA